MGGRGTYSLGKKPEDTYKTVDKIAGVPVLKGIGRYHSLPEESKTSNIYIKLKPDGTFHELRIYDEDHYLTKEIAYHPEPKINNGDRIHNILHVHEYKRDNFENRPARKITDAEYEEYKKYFKGVKHP